MRETTYSPNLSFLLQNYIKKDQQKDNFYNTRKMLVSEGLISIAFWCILIMFSIVFF